MDRTGRGHAICDLFVRTNPDVTVYYGPGCDVVEHDRIVPVPSISVADPRTALDFLATTPVEFVLVSHIDALCAGYVDELREAGHAVIGPTAAAAELESSKARGKEFCLDHGIPIPEFGVFTDAAEARAHIRALPHQCVVKIDGLTPNGDGSVVCSTAAEAEAAVDAFAAAGGPLRLVVEERLTGPEVSVFALLAGGTAMMLPLALDYKRALEGDAGKNCDGMGSVAPHPADSPALRAELRAALVDPLVRGLAAEGLDFTGFAYVGAVLTDRGPVVIEINARFGDSEAEVVLPGVVSDFTGLCRAVLAGELDRHDLAVDGLARCSVALVQGCLDPTDPEALPGWPFGPFADRQPVRGLDKVDPLRAKVFHAEIARDAGGSPVTRGGRVVHVVGAGATSAEARRRAYEQVGHIEFAGMRYRADIGAVGADRGRPPAGDDQGRSAVAGLAPILSQG
ncbi:phosphoribosylamine--glycine ligase [Actinosynnema sp. NPDC020468]|uniref:phosphoribosylamine--glycine ligase n=1 Tax=Actinosynnema sp. NPDC020468 TaxID=3154488 RepID=UPI0034034123